MANACYLTQLSGQSWLDQRLTPDLNLSIYWLSSHQSDSSNLLNCHRDFKKIMTWSDPTEMLHRPMTGAATLVRCKHQKPPKRDDRGHLDLRTGKGNVLSQPSSCISSLAELCVLCLGVWESCPWHSVISPSLLSWGWGGGWNICSVYINNLSFRH